MKQVVLKGIRKMEMIEIPDTAVIHPNEVKIKMSTIGVCGSDIH